MFLGMDLGGTYIKAAIIENHKILKQMRVPTQIPERRVSEAHATAASVPGAPATSKHVSESLAPAMYAVEENVELCDRLIDQICEVALQVCVESSIPFNSITKLGIGIPGLIKGSKGPVLFAPNINWYNADPVPVLEERLKIPVCLGNDADCMALAEDTYGAGRPFKHFLMLTLGTAVGAAIIVDGGLFKGFGPYGGELGHIPLFHGGFPCSCGVRGCFEQYGSAEALKRLTIEAMRNNRSSYLWKLCSEDLSNIGTSDLFTAVELGDETARAALNEFVTYLCEGIAGLVNIFRPEAVILGGGLANAGEPLFDRVNRILSNLTYASEYIPAPPVIKAELGTYAGALGAAGLG